MLCAWCGKFMYYLTFPSKLDSHGVCDDCLKKNFPDIYKEMQAEKRDRELHERTLP